jgi:DNA-binding GntR family transcriptional regulator
MAKAKSQLVGRSGVCAAECMQILPRREGESGSAYAYRVLSYNILMLYVTPGAWIREASIAEQLDVSRTPVHEAMIMLRDRGMVEVAPQSASHVSRIDISAMRQSFFLRAAIEPLVIAQLSDTISERNMRALSDCLHVMQKVSEQKFHEAEFLALDNRFHEIIYDAANKGYVWETLKKSSSHYDRMINMGVLFGYVKPNCETAEMIFRFLERGTIDARDMQKRVRESLSQYVGYFDKIVNDFPTYFLFEGVPAHAATSNPVHYEP